VPVTFRHGVKPPHPEETHPRMKFAQIRRRGVLPSAPSLVDYVTKVLTWPMYANDKWGDCVWAMIGHSIQAFTTYGRGKTITVTEADVINAYTAVTGFDPDAGPPGKNPTDQGTVIQDALNYWRKTGVGGHKILAFAEVNVTDPEEVDAALNLFGHLQLGINFPDTAMDQFNNGEPWDVVSHARIEGGHAVDLGLAHTIMQSQLQHGQPTVVSKNTRGNYEVITWAGVQEMTPAFWRKYVTECWVVVSEEWISVAGASPPGLDEAALNDAFEALTGQPGPLPVQPTPDPAPTPEPSGCLGHLLDELKALVKKYGG
jgi:hypothetical protein